ncbi:MAG TPA: chromosomal replication initiator protein DnaA [Oligoflexia bacterium]|nr:chromosomal replication initiator protein DnaA [Oligoflexia bacterium]HMP48121.1 chromosomal replication initiator protein DnaA [Oligoflexia bacterium]
MERVSDLLEAYSPHEQSAHYENNTSFDQNRSFNQVSNHFNDQPIKHNVDSPDISSYDISSGYLSLEDLSRYFLSFDKNELWNNICKQIRPRLDEQIYAAWFRPLFISKIVFNDGPVEEPGSDSKSKLHIYISAPNKFSRDHLKNNYQDLIRSGFVEFSRNRVGEFSTKETGVPFELLDRIEIKFDVADSVSLAVRNSAKNESVSSTLPSPETINSDLGPDDNTTVVSALVVSASNNKSSIQKYASNIRKPVLSETEKQVKSESLTLNPGYNFSNFVIGNCNQFAHAACLKVSESPGTSYNPLLIYGGVGLGKTHLANAIGNAASRRKKKVLLVSSETFVSELIASLKTNSMDRFKNKFRSLDILIIDDIQFIIGKERTQEEFFHTFNELYGKQKQIIITSDKPPRDLIGLEERLRTRFASGLSVDLQAPDFETRVAILSKKAEHAGFEIPTDVARIIANRIDTNVRELEGALIRLQALCSLLGEQASIDIAQKVIDTIAPSKNRELTTDAIKQVVAKQFNVSINDLVGKRRTQNVALARQVAMYLCRKHTARSFPEIGAIFGGRDHSTVIHAIKSVNDKLCRTINSENNKQNNPETYDAASETNKIRDQIELINNILLK